MQTPYQTPNFFLAAPLCLAMTLFPQLIWMHGAYPAFNIDAWSLYKQE